jgi:hypothetical protein
VESLAESGIGVVYEVDDLRLGRQVAIKFFPESAATGPEFLRPAPARGSRRRS